jgi:hypothetical protein
MIQPIVSHELDPKRRKHIKKWRLLVGASCIGAEVWQALAFMTKGISRIGLSGKKFSAN